MDNTTAFILCFISFYAGIILFAINLEYPYHPNLSNVTQCLCCGEASFCSDTLWLPKEGLCRIGHNPSPLLGIDYGYRAPSQSQINYCYAKFNYSVNYCKW